MPTENSSAARAQTRLRGLLIHLIVYFTVSAAAFVINITTDPETAWFVLPVVGWGSFLAVHVAYAMGLFDVFSNKQGRD